jgi:hypothetical protein
VNLRGAILVAVAASLTITFGGRADPRPLFAPQSAGSAGYAYAGVDGPEGARGVRATVSLLAHPHVPNVSAHVAAWVGVAEKVDGKLYWFQVGIATDNAVIGTGDFLYVEHKTPAGYRLQTIKADVPVGKKVKLAVEELGDGRWHALADGKRIGEPVKIPFTSGRWNTTVTAENLGPGKNEYRYSFEDMAVIEAGAWRPLHVTHVYEDSTNEVVHLAHDRFIARTREQRLLKGFTGALDGQTTDSASAPAPAASTSPAPASLAPASAAPATPAPAPRTPDPGALGDPSDLAPR